MPLRSIGFLRQHISISCRQVLLPFLGLLFLAGGVRASANAGFPVRYNGTVSILVNGGVTTPQGVAVDLAGNVYVADTGGNRIIRATPDGTTAVFSVSISGTPVTFSSPKQLAIDSAGSLYITDSGNNRIIKTDPSGNGTLLSIGSSLSPASLNAPQGVAVDSSGDVFISDTGNNRIVEIPASGSPAVVTTSSLSSPEGVAVDIFGNLYVVDTGHNRVIKKPTTGAESTLSTFGSLSSPVAVGVGMNGNVYIVDGTNRIAVVSPQGDAYDLFFDEVNSDFGVPSAIAITASGTVYIPDSSGDKVNVFQVDAAGFSSVTLGSSGTPQTLRFVVNGTATLTRVAIYTSGTQDLDFTIAANAGTPCTTGSNAISCTVNVQFTPTTAGLRRGALVLSYTDTSFGTGSLEVPLFGIGNAPVSVLSPGVASVVNVGSVSVAQPFQTARDGAGNIYVTSYQNSTLLKVPAGGGSGTTVTIPSLPTPHTLNSPTGLAIDGAGNLFVADYNNSRIVEVTPAGTSKVIAIRGLSSNLSFPTTLNFTPNGRLLVDDYGNGRVILLSPDIYDNANNDGDGSVGFAAAYVLPLGSYTLGSDNSTSVVSDATGNVYFTDQNSNPGRIIRLDPLGKLTTVSLPGVTLNAPLGVAVDPSQNLFVVDSGNQRVIQQTTSGSTSIVKYSGPSLGQFVFGLDVDGSGNLLISDFINNRLILDNVSQSSLTFPSTREYLNSATKTTTVTNLGDQPLIFSANPTFTANFSQDTNDTNPCTSDTSLSSGSSCDVPIIFSPQAVGSLSANITITNDTLNVGGSTQVIAVSGTSTNPGDVTTTTKTNPSATSYSYGQPITISAKVADTTNTSSVPTGTVTFTDALTSTITQKTLDSGGNATLLSNGLLSGIGTHSILASYGGVAATYQASSTTISVTINKDTVGVTGPSQVSVTNGQTGSATITVAPTISGSLATGTALPSGSITYSILSGSTTVVGPTTASLTAGSSSSTASVAIPNTLASGSYTISVTYAGDGNYQPASAITVLLTIQQLTPTITWSPATSMTYGTSLSGLLNATASYNNSSVAGTFAYTATLQGGSTSAVTSATVLGAGTYTLTAAFTPTDTTTYTNKSASATVTVNKATPTVSWSPSSSSISYGTTLSGILDATASFSSSNVAGSFAYAATPVGGSASSVTNSSVLGAGSYTLAAVFTPTDSTDYNGATGTASLTVAKANATTTLISSINPTILTGAVTFTATVSSPSSLPTGSVGFYDGTTLLGTVALSSGTAAYTTSSLAAGPHSITAIYSGDSNFGSATSSAVSELIQDFTISTPTSSGGTPSQTVNPGGTATYTLNIGPSVGTLFPAPVTLSLSGLPPGATGSLSPTTLPAGSSLSSVTLTIQLPQTTKVEASPNPWRGAPLAVGVLLLPFARKWRRAGKKLGAWFTMLALLTVSMGALAGLSGCASKNGFFGQAPATYAITVTATSGSLSHSTNVLLTVE